MDAAALGGQLSGGLGEPIVLAVAWEPLGEEALTPGERTQAQAYRNPDRRRDWSRGRAALKALLRAAGQDGDTSALVFPHARFSLTHTRQVAVAASRDLGRADGIGVDLEQGRVVQPGAERFYLDERERAWLDALAEEARPLARLRLWTVKEALFKAHLGNAGTVVGDYRVVDPAAEAGEAAVAGEASVVLRYATARVPDGFLTVAVRKPAGGLTAI